MRLVLLLQACIYLLVAPAILLATGTQKSWPIAWFLFTVIGLLIGMILGASRKQGPPGAPVREAISFRPIVDQAFAAYALTYSLVVVSEGLTNRRVGFYEAAARAAEMPLPLLAFLRVFETLLWPFVILRIYEQIKQGRRFPKYLVAAIIVGFLSTGVADSRTSVIIPFLVYLMFFGVPRVKVGISKRVASLAAVGLVGVGIYGYSQRGKAFSSFREMIIVDFAARLDGFDLLRYIEAFRGIPFWGTWDLAFLGPVVAMNPFSSAARELKAQGLTSTKTYLIRQVVDSSGFDAVSPLIVDPIYFGGVPLLIVTMALLGFAASRFDIAVKTGTWLQSRLATAFYMSLALSAMHFEGQLSALVLGVFRSAAIIFAFLALTSVTPEGGINARSKSVSVRQRERHRAIR